MSIISIRAYSIQWLQYGYLILRQYGPPLNFITLHYAYFILTSLISAIILWATSTSPQSLSFVDALFLTVSAMSCAGLNTVNLSGLNSFQQSVLFLLIMLGSVILVSITVIYIRKAAFESRFAHLLRQQTDSQRSTHQRNTSDHRCGETKYSADSKPESNETPGMERQIPDAAARDILIRRFGECAQSHRRITDASTTPDGLADAEKSQTLRPANDTISLDLRDDTKDVDTRSESYPTVSFVKSRETSRRPRVFSFSGVGARQDPSNHPRTAHPRDTGTVQAISNPKLPENPSSNPNTSSGLRIGRNSQFSSLTVAERNKLGGVEYRALKALGIVVPAYYILFQLFGCIGLGAWVSLNASEVATNNGLNPWWAGAFNAVSAFNNSGMSLIDANMVAFQWSYYMMITMGMLILVGNTCYPVLLRLIFWSLWKLTPVSKRWENTRVALRFILDHPRRVYTNLFPASHTWFLLGTVITLNAIDWLGFEILNIGNPYVEALPGNLRIIDGLFQATAVRSGGFYVVPIANIAIAVQVLYVVMMYISVYPVTMTMRSSNVYEERSLGIYAGDIPHRKALATADRQARELEAPLGLIGRLLRRSANGKLFAETGTHSRSYFIRQQLRSQLAHDLWWICLAVFLIMIIEGGQFAQDPVAFSVFNILFEVVSGYGTVGISVGLPNQAYSFCGGWHALSKLILCAVMLRGRHRGLPVAIDRAVLLPHEHLADAEEEDARLAADEVFEVPSTVFGQNTNVHGAFRARAPRFASDHVV